MAEYKKGDWVRAKDAYVAEHWNMYWSSDAGVTADRDTVFKVYDAFAADDTITIGVGKAEKGPTWSSSRFEPWRPKVGERVRVVGGSTTDEYLGVTGFVELDDGASYMNLRISLDKPIERFGDMAIWRSAKHLEPITDPLPVAEQPAARESAGGGFMAGDKIELVQGEIDGIRAIGDVYEAVAHKKPAHEDSVCFIGNKGEVTWAPGEYFKLHQPLRIQAGRYYKTRDGRKVGPMERNGDRGGHCYWKAPRLEGYGPYWCKNGDFYEGSREHENDLIAEWFDTPVRSITAATVDAINDEYGPVVREVPVVERAARFKVGDRVKVKKSVMDVTAGKTYEVVEVDPEDEAAPVRIVDDAGDLWWLTVRDFDIVAPATTAIVALIKDGQPLPASRPHVHTSTEAADAEARRLAGIHKGQEFGVFVLTGTTHKVERTVEPGDNVIVSADLRVTSVSRGKANVVVNGGGSFTLPVSALVAA